MITNEIMYGGLSDQGDRLPKTVQQVNRRWKDKASYAFHLNFSDKPFTHLDEARIVALFKVTPKAHLK